MMHFSCQLHCFGARGDISLMHNHAAKQLLAMISEHTENTKHSHAFCTAQAVRAKTYLSDSRTNRLLLTFSRLCRGDEHSHES